MKSGNRKIGITLTGKFKHEDFTYHHQNQNCTGTWSLMIQKDVPFPLVGLGTSLFPMAVFVVCPTCKAAYLLPGFLDFIEHSIASYLVVSDRLLTPQELKFLRVVFGMTQRDVVGQIEMDSVSYYSKCETGKTGFSLGSDKQVRLKLLYATKLGIHSPEEYRKISLTNAKRDQSERRSLIEFQRRLQPDIEKIAAEFRVNFRIPEIITVKHG